MVYHSHIGFVTSTSNSIIWEFINGGMNGWLSQQGTFWRVIGSNNYSPEFNMNTWHNATITIASNGAYTAYHDGVAFDIGSSPGFRFTPLTGTLPSGRIGRSLVSGNASLNGNIDGFRIYNKVLTQDEVTGLYNNNNTFIPRKLSITIISESNLNMGKNISVKNKEINIAKLMAPITAIFIIVIYISLGLFI